MRKNPFVAAFVVGSLAIALAVVWLAILTAPGAAQNVSLQCTGGSIGVWPNCTCPAGMVWGEVRTSTGTARRCVPGQQTGTCPPHLPSGSYPNCCPAGQVYFYKECRTLATQCSPGMVGTPPNCNCPPGTVYRRTFSRTAPRCVPG